MAALKVAWKAAWKADLLAGLMAEQKAVERDDWLAARTAVLKVVWMVD